MGNSNDLSNRINEAYSTLSKGQKLLASYITDNYDKAVFLTAAKLGEVVGVSESTVVRFATHLGYKGYPDFQKALEELVRNKLRTADGGGLWTDQSVKNLRICSPVRRGKDQRIDRDDRSERL